MLLFSDKKSFRNRLLKNVSVLLLGAFVAQDPVRAWAEIRLDSPAPSAYRPVLNLSPTVASVEESFKADASRTVYLVQDAHTNYSAQKNIAATLQYLIDKEGVRTVYVEGGFGDVSLTGLKIADPKTRWNAGMRYLRSGELSGAEFVNLTGQTDFTLQGVEENELYWRSLDLYRRVASGRRGQTAYLANIRRSVQTLKAEFLHPLLRGFDRKREAFLEGELSFGDYFSALQKYALWLGQPLSGHPQLERLAALAEAEKRIDFKAAGEQAYRAARLVEERNPGLLEESLRGKSEALKLTAKNSRATEAFYALLEESLRASAAPSYPDLSRYFDYLKRARAIRPADILREQQALEKKVYEALAQNEDERKMLAAGDQLRQWEALLSLSILPNEFQALFSETSPSPTDLTGFMNRKIVDLEDHYDRTLFLNDGFEKTLEDAQAFYDTTRKRDERFIEKMLARMSEKGETKAALVAGGYHSPNLKALLKARNVSFVCVTPQVLSETNIERYEKLLLGQTAQNVIASKRSERSSSQSVGNISLLAVQNRAPQTNPTLLTGARLARELSGQARLPKSKPHRTEETALDHAWRLKEELDKTQTPLTAWQLALKTGIDVHWVDNDLRLRFFDHPNWKKDPAGPEFEPAAVTVNKIKAFQEELDIDPETLSGLLKKHPHLAGYSPARVRDEWQRELGIDRKTLSGFLRKWPQLAGYSPTRVRDEWQRELGIDRKTLLDLLRKWPQLAGYSVQGNLKLKWQILGSFGLDRTEKLKGLLRLATKNIRVVQTIVEVISELPGNAGLLSVPMIHKIYYELNQQFLEREKLSVTNWIKRYPDKMDAVLKPIIRTYLTGARLAADDALRGRIRSGQSEEDLRAEIKKIIEKLRTVPPGKKMDHGLMVRLEEMVEDEYALSQDFDYQEEILEKLDEISADLVEKRWFRYNFFSVWMMASLGFQAEIQRNIDGHHLFSFQFDAMENKSDAVDGGIPIHISDVSVEHNAFKIVVKDDLNRPVDIEKLSLNVHQALRFYLNPAGAYLHEDPSDLLIGILYYAPSGDLYWYEGKAGDRSSDLIVRSRNEDIHDAVRFLEEVSMFNSLGAKGARLTSGEGYWKNEHPEKPLEPIFTKKEFEDARNIVSEATRETPFIELSGIGKMLGKTVFLKDESVQESGSFKMRGVYYQVYSTLLRLAKEKPEILAKGVKIVTQSTGNHGIALIESVSKAIEVLSEKFPTQIESFQKVEPVVFSYRDIPEVKREAIKKAMDHFRSRWNSRGGGLHGGYSDYEEAKKAREKFIADNAGRAFYMDHGGPKIMLGHGSAGLEIIGQLREKGVGDDKKVVLLVPVGEGGPIGIGAAMKMFRDNVKVVMVQAEGLDAFVRTLQSGHLRKNLPPDMKKVLSDGIAVDGPDEAALSAAKVFIDAAVIAEEKERLQRPFELLRDDLAGHYKDKNPILTEGTTALVLEALLENKDIDEIRRADVVVLLGTGGNVLPQIGYDERVRGEIRAFDSKISMGLRDGRLRYAGEEPVVKLSENDFTFIAVRHAETIANTKGGFQGKKNGAFTDPTPDGLRQAQEAAEKLYNYLRERIEAGDDVLVVSSPQGRAKRDAERFRKIVQQKSDRKLPFSSKFPREMSWGIFDGKTKGEIEGDPHLARAFEEFERAFKQNGDARVAPPGGASYLRNLIRTRPRFQDFVNRMRARQKNNGGRKLIVVAFGHGTRFSMISALLGDKSLLSEDEKGPYIDFWQKRLPNAQPVIFNPQSRRFEPIEAKKKANPPLARYPEPVEYRLHDWTQSRPRVNVIGNGTFLSKYPGQLKYLREVAAPKLFEKKTGSKRLKISFLGARTGEEVASVFYALGLAFGDHPEWGLFEDLNLELIVQDTDKDVLLEAKRRLGGSSPFVYSGSLRDKAKENRVMNVPSFSHRIFDLRAPVQFADNHYPLLKRALRFLPERFDDETTAAHIRDSNLVFANVSFETAPLDSRSLQHQIQKSSKRPIVFTTNEDFAKSLENYSIHREIENGPQSLVAIPRSHGARLARRNSRSRAELLADYEKIKAVLKKASRPLTVKEIAEKTDILKSVVENDLIIRFIDSPNWLRPDQPATGSPDPVHRRRVKRKVDVGAYSSLRVQLQLSPNLFKMVLQVTSVDEIQARLIKAKDAAFLSDLAERMFLKKDEDKRTEVLAVFREAVLRTIDHPVRRARPALAVKPLVTLIKRAGGKKTKEELADFLDGWERRLRPPRAGARLAVDDKKVESFLFGTRRAFPQVTSASIAVPGVSPAVLLYQVSGLRLSLMDGATEAAGTDLAGLDGWKQERSGRAQKMRELSVARFASEKTQKTIARLSPVVPSGQLQGHVGFDIAQISAQIGDDAVFSEVVGFWSELLEARHGNYFIAGMEKLTPARNAKTRQVLARVGERANISYARPKNTAIAWVDFVKEGNKPIQANREEGELVVRASGFDSDQLANIQAALVIAENAAALYAPRLQGGKIPQQGEGYADILKAVQQGSLPEIFHQFSQDRTRPDAKTLHDYLTGGLAAGQAAGLVLRPLARFIDDLASAIRLIRRTVEISA